MLSSQQAAYVFAWPSDQTKTYPSLPPRLQSMPTGSRRGRVGWIGARSGGMGNGCTGRGEDRGRPGEGEGGGHDRKTPRVFFRRWATQCSCSTSGLSLQSDRPSKRGSWRKKNARQHSGIWITPRPTPYTTRSKTRILRQRLPDLALCGVSCRDG